MKQPWTAPNSGRLSDNLCFCCFFMFSVVLYFESCSLSLSNTLVNTEISWQLLDGFQLNFVQTFMFSRGWIWPTLVILRFLLWQHTLKLIGMIVISFGSDSHAPLRLTVVLWLFTYSTTCRPSLICRAVRGPAWPCTDDQTHSVLSLHSQSFS